MVWSSILGSITAPIIDIIDKAVVDKDEAARLKQEVTLAMMTQGASELEAQKSIILAEAGGQGLKANWRPLLMLTVVAIVANNFLVAPYVNALFGAGTAPILALPDQLWNLMNLGVGGYIVSRGVEKTMSTYVVGNKQ